MTDAASRRAAQRLADGFAGLNNRVTAAEATARTPQLQHASITGTAITVYDVDGETPRGMIGLQTDGTVGVVAVNGPTPPTPSAPTVDAATLGLSVSWDGTFTDDADQPADFDHVAVHLSTADGFTPDATTLYGTLTRAGSISLTPLTTVAHYAVLVAVSTSGVESDPSEQVAGTPDAVVATEVLDGIVDTLALADDAVTNAKIADTAVDANKLADGSVSASKIVEGAIGTDQLADNAVTTGKLGDAAVDTAQLASGAVDASKILDGAVGTTQLGDDAVTAAKLADGSVGASNIVAGSITSGLLADGAVDADALADGAVSAAAIAADAIGTDAIQDGAITTGLLAADAVTADIIAAGAVGADQIAANAVVAGKVAADAIGADQIIAGAVTAGKIDADAVTATEIAAGAIGTTELAANAVTAGKIAADTITASQIAAGAIGATELAANSVVAGKIAAGVVDTTELAAQAVTTAKIDALAVTADQIAANAITAGKIDAGAVTAETLAAQIILASTIESQDYAEGSAGWKIDGDGTAEFNDFTARGKIVISGADQELFVYDGSAAAGTLIASIAAQAGTDDFGNDFAQGVQIGAADGSQMKLTPTSGQQFASGLFEAALQLTTTDADMVVPSTLGGVIFNQGLANQQMASVLQSPIGAGNGTALVLNADADDGSTDATVTIGTVTATDEAVSYTPIIEVASYGMSSTGYFVYGTAGQSTKTVTATGSGTWTAPAGVTSVKVECWGAGGGGQGGSGAGGSGGEYAAEYELAVTPGTTYSYSVGAGGAGGPGGVGGPGSDGGNTTFIGDTVTVTAHGGEGSGSATTAGGTGSTNSVHHDGGGSHADSTGPSHGGAGGGGSGGYSAAGNAGASNSGTSGGAGAAAVAGGGGGGDGGRGVAQAGEPGKAGGRPGGGGGAGGAGEAVNSAGGDGANGQIRLTYTPDTNPLVGSISPVAGTDVFGNSYPEGVWSTQGAILSSTVDADTTTGNRPALITGDPNGRHLRIDGNEILAMTDDTTQGPMYIDNPFVGYGGGAGAPIPATLAFVGPPSTSQQQTSTGGEATISDAQIPAVPFLDGHVYRAVFAMQYDANGPGGTDCSVTFRVYLGTSSSGTLVGATVTPIIGQVYGSFRPSHRVEAVWRQSGDTESHVALTMERSQGDGGDGTGTVIGEVNATDFFAYVQDLGPVI